MMFRIATAEHGLKWRPADFYSSTPRELWAALDAAEEHAREMKARGNAG
jgi:hypothetical protein